MLNKCRYVLFVMMVIVLGYTPHLSYAQDTTGEQLQREWTQHAADAQHTSFVPQEIPTPWRWKWAWNGPNASGAVSGGKFSLPRNVQPVTGDGRVYIAAGQQGIYAISLHDGSAMWHRNTLGTNNSTVAYDPQTRTVLALSTDGILYQLDAVTGEIIAQFDTGSPSEYPLPPAIDEQTAFVATGTQVLALDIPTFEPNWIYTLDAAVQTPPAYSPSTNRVIVVAEDLYVSAIDNADGALLWRVKPTTRTASEDEIDFIYGWPVIAEQHGMVFIKARLDWDTLWTWSPWPTTNAAIRANLTQQPDQQALFALDLSDGTTPFTMNVGHGGYGDGGYLPMGPQPVVKTLPAGNEVLMMIGRGDDANDGRWDSKFVEILLDAGTVSGYSGGEVRFIEYDGLVLTDEQPNITVAGSQVLAGHWMAGYSLQITDRDPALGAYDNRIRTTLLPHIVTSASNCGFSASHYCDMLIQDVDPRHFPAGFYIYYGVGPVYDQYWSGYSTWVVSGTTILYRSTDGAIIAIESAATSAAAPAASILSLPDAAAPSAYAAEDSRLSTINYAALPHIDYRQARSFAGQSAQITGTIQFVFNNGKHVYLGFANPHQGSFKVMIPKSLWGRFSAAPETLYHVGQQITAAGHIRWYQGDPVIEALSPQQIMADSQQAAMRAADVSG